MPAAPPGIAAFTRRVVLGLLVLVAALAIVLAAAQQAFPTAFYEFQVFRSLAGVVRSQPYPILEVRRPGKTSAAQAVSQYYLVGPGKQGADDLVAGLEGEHVELEGSLIYRQDQTVVEVVPGSPRKSDESAAPGVGGDGSLGRQTLRGEIVDSKCYAGLMKPDRGKPHRACASLCIRGGAPPLFVVEDEGGTVLHLLLTGADGRALGEEILPWVAEPLEITGEVARRGHLWFLRADPASFRRL